MIPSALHKINYDVISVKEKPQAIQFTEKELNILGKYVYKRRVHKKRTDQPQVPWDNLSSDSRNTIIESIKTWPEILAESHFKIERLKFLCHCETQL